MPARSQSALSCPASPAWPCPVRPIRPLPGLSIIVTLRLHLHQRSNTNHRTSPSVYRTPAFHALFPITRLLSLSRLSRINSSVSYYYPYPQLLPAGSRSITMSAPPPMLPPMDMSTGSGFSPDFSNPAPANGQGTQGGAPASPVAERSHAPDGHTQEAQKFQNVPVPDPKAQKEVQEVLFSDVWSLNLRNTHK